MNYLETGLPHTDFVRRKSDFSPPRFIPLCSLGRKYRGLEPLTRQEVGILIKRLSEPKRNSEAEDPSPAVEQVRRKATPGTGRFVGQKKMSGLEIEKMVERLYSRRATKDYAFVDETVTADDIINTTNWNDDSDDSENEADEGKIVKDRENSLLRGENSANINKERERKYSTINRRDSTSTNEPMSWSKSRTLQEKIDITAVPSLQLRNRPKTSVTFQRAQSWTETKKNIDENQPVSDRRNNLSSYISRPKIKRSKSSPGQRPLQSPSEKSEAFQSPRLQPTTTNNQPHLFKSDVFKKFERLEEGCSIPQTFIDTPNSCGAELTRPSSSNLLWSFDTQNTTSNDQARLTKSDKATKEGTDTPKSASSVSKKLDSPRLKTSKKEDGKLPRFAVTPCDELLIDRVAIYNRSPKLRSK